MKNIFIRAGVYLAIPFLIFGCQNKPAANPQKLGILVISHGYYRSSWNDLVREMMLKVNSPYPVRLAFMDFVSGQDIKEAVKSLKQEGVDKIRVIPFLFCSYSSHIMQILDIFSIKHKYQSPVDNVNEGIAPINNIALPVEITSALDFHPLLGEVMLERLRELTVSPKNEVLVIFIHGSSYKEIREHKKEEEIISRYIGYFKKHNYGFSEFITVWGSHSPQWDSLQEIIEKKINAGKTVNILPFLISHYEEVDGVIKKCVEFACKNTGKDTSYVRYRGKGVLPHINCSRWLEEQIDEPKMLDRDFYGLN